MEEKEKEISTTTEAPERPASTAAETTVVEESKTAPATPGRVKAFWASKFPDKTYGSDEEFDNMLADHLEESDKRLGEYASSEDTFRRVATEHPELLDVVKDLSEDKEMPLIEAIYRNVDPEEFLPEEGEPEFDRMRQARQTRLGRQAEAEEFRKKLENNLEESKKVIQEYFEQRGMPEKDQHALADFIDGIFEQYTQNQITAEILDAFNHARTYNKDVSDAREIGAIEGKNAKIDAQRQRRAEETDGLPSAGSSAGVIASETAPKDFMDDLLEKTSKRRNWMKG